MNTLVVDASVVAKWFPPFDNEPLASEARQILEEWAKGRIALVAPDLLLIEVANALCMAARRSRCSDSEARQSLALLHDCHLPSVPAERLSVLALDLAMQNQRSVYDCMYVALALTSGTHLITADEKLANALAAKLPVKLLGAIP